MLKGSVRHCEIYCGRRSTFDRQNILGRLRKSNAVITLYRVGKLSLWNIRNFESVDNQPNVCIPHYQAVHEDWFHKSSLRKERPRIVRTPAAVKKVQARIQCNSVQSVIALCNILGFTHNIIFEIDIFKLISVSEYSASKKDYRWRHHFWILENLKLWK